MDWRPKENFDIRYGDAKFGVCPAGIWSCFGPVSPHYAPFLMFWNGNVMYILCHYMLEVCFLILILQGITVKKLHESQKRFWTLKQIW